MSPLHQSHQGHSSQQEFRFRETDPSLPENENCSSMTALRRVIPRSDAHSKAGNFDDSPLCGIYNVGREFILGATVCPHSTRLLSSPAAVRLWGNFKGAFPISLPRNWVPSWYARR